MINASYLPTPNLVTIIKGMTPNQAIFNDDEVIAFYVKEDEEVNFDTYEIVEYTFDDLFTIAHTWDIFCLLYTSPSPRDLSTSRMPSSA